MSDYRMQLNNLLQNTGQANSVSYDTLTAGPQHAVTWTAIIYIGGVEYGRGQGPNAAAAKEAAAYQALQAISRDRGY